MTIGLEGRRDDRQISGQSRSIVHKRFDGYFESPDFIKIKAANDSVLAMKCHHIIPLPFS